MSEEQGLFVTIEGVEGAGKSTLAESLAEHFRGRGLEVVSTAEPGGDPVSERIRRLLLDSVDSIADRAELLLFEAARAQHVESTILPALARGAMVICDRFADSSLAYQGYARGIDRNTVRMLNDYATHSLRPDLTILLDVSSRVGLQRQRRTDRISSESTAFHVAVREGYLAIAADDPERFLVLDAAQSADEVLQAAVAAVELKLPSTS